MVLLYPDDPSKSYIKRVVGLPGEEINVENGKLYVNGMQIDEPYLDSEYLSSDSMAGSVHVKDHHYFVMGDNRSLSLDSRPPDGHGMPAASDILGVVRSIIVSREPSRIGMAP